MARGLNQVVYEVSVSRVEEAIRALEEGEAKEVRFIIVTIREVKPCLGLRQ